MSDEIKRVKRELKFKGKIIDFYQDTMEINGGSYRNLGFHKA